jgi:hypothetical protein
LTTQKVLRFIYLGPENIRFFDSSTRTKIHEIAHHPIASASSEKAFSNHIHQFAT